ncbi:MAG TPA: HEAT repeat domain-containing protein [Tepidisphaeraceae bacterium]|nr:HEAT repeat domain-containing protein [Tepidisphaeraceae bacterium]
MSAKKPTTKTNRKLARYSATPAGPKKLARRMAKTTSVVEPTPTPSSAALPPQSVATLILALRDPSADTAREAAMVLGKLGDASAVVALIEAVENSNGYFHSVVRAAACASLGHLRDCQATPALIKAVRDPMAEASAEAVRALALLGDDRAIEPLMEVARNENGYFLPVVRLAAINALRQFDDPRAAALLKALAANQDEDSVLRAAAAVRK